MSDQTAALINLLLLIVLPAGFCGGLIVLPHWLLPKPWSVGVSALGVLLLLIWGIWFWSFINTPWVTHGPA